MAVRLTAKFEWSPRIFFAGRAEPALSATGAVPVWREAEEGARFIVKIINVIENLKWLRHFVVVVVVFLPACSHARKYAVRTL